MSFQTHMIVHLQNTNLEMFDIRENSDPAYTRNYHIQGPERY